MGEAINLFAFETIDKLSSSKDRKVAKENFVKASGKAILKIMSKMGISTLKSIAEHKFLMQ